MIPGVALPTLAARILRRGWLPLLSLFLSASSLHAKDDTFTNLMAQGELCDQQHDSHAALDIFLKAEPLSPTNAEVLFQLAKQNCDMMHLAKNEAEKKEFAAKCLAYAIRAAAADPQSPKAHVCVAVCCAKNFPFIDNQTKVNYSRQIKLEAEKAIALDPNYDIPYHMLGRWNCEVANMNLLLKSIVKIVYGGLPGASNDQAIQNFKKAIELSPGRIIHHLQLAHVYHLTGKKKPALDELKICATLTPLDLDDTAAQKIAAKIIATGRWPSIF